MSRTVLTLLASGAVVSIAMAADTKSPTTKPDFRTTYGVLTERNMFLKERRAPRPPGSDRPQTRTPRDDDSPQARERQTVLRGVAIEDNELHAYLENTRNNQIIRVSPGDKLVNGNVVEIAIDAIAYSSDGKTAWIDIGQNLAGVHTAAAPGTDSASGSGGSSAGTSGAPSAGPSATLPADGGSLEERMRARRAKERGGR